MRRKILFTHKHRLTTSELYQTACGMIEAAGFHCELTIAADGLFQGTDEYARVYSNGVTSHVVYYPGKDTDDLTHFPKVIPLSHLRKYVETQLEANGINPASTIKHFFIAEVGRLSLGSKKLTHAEHYVYAHQFENQVTIEDSMDRNLVTYDKSGIKAALGDVYFEEIDRDQQMQVVDTWQCGHFAVKYFQNQILLRPHADLSINREVLAEHSSYYNRTEQIPINTTFFERHYILRNVLIASALILGIAGVSLAIVASYGILGGVIALAVCASIGSALTLTGVFSGILTAVNNYFNRRTDLENLQNATDRVSPGFQPKAGMSQAGIYAELKYTGSDEDNDEEDFEADPTLPLLLVKKSPSITRAEVSARQDSPSPSSMRPD